MGDKKILLSFDVEDQFSLSKKRRRQLCKTFQLPFSDQDFEQMQRALNRSYGVYTTLNDAPSFIAPIDYCDKIEKAAHALRTLLRPDAEPWRSMKPPHLWLNEPKLSTLEFKTASMIASLVRDRMLDAPDDFFNTLWLNVSQIRDKLLQAPNVSERGTAHFAELLEGLQSVAKRHHKPTKYTHMISGDESGDVPEKFVTQSFVATLAYHLAQLLPAKARPSSVGALASRLARLSTSPKRRGPRTPK